MADIILNPAGVESTEDIPTPVVQFVPAEGTLEITLHLAQVVDKTSGFSHIVSVPQRLEKAERVYMIGHIAQSGAVVEHEALIYAYGKPLTDSYGEISVFAVNPTESAEIEVYKEGCDVYRPVLMRYLPKEFDVKDTTDDLKNYLDVVAISMDEFYCFIEDFTSIFDPDRCPEKYLPHLARLINYPLNTRGFDSKVPSIKDAAVRRGRVQLKQAVEVYRRKGLKEAFEILFFGLGYYVELVELWTNNYVSFHAEVPATATLYHPVTNPNGWYKSPYFGIKFTSISQQTICTTGGEGQPWSFDSEDLKELYDALHSIRPVHTVLWWLEYIFDLCDDFTAWGDVPEISDIEFVGEEKFGYAFCEPDDPQYYRLDERLEGVLRDYAPETDPTLPSPEIAELRFKRLPELGLCHPAETFTIEMSDIEWAEEAWCTPVYRDAGLLYRNGSNLALRDGSVPTRDPSAFDGRNGGYWKDAPLAPFPSDLVPDRGGCYMTEERLTPLYQIAEEFEDGVVMYYNKYEFHNWLDTIALGPGPDPDRLGRDAGTPPLATTKIAATTVKSLWGNRLVDTLDPATLWSMFGINATLTTPVVNRLNFVSGLLGSIDEITPTGAVTGAFGGGYVGVYQGKIHYLFGYRQTVAGSPVAWDGKLVYDPSNNSLVDSGETFSTTVVDAASAQVGTKLYLFGGSLGANYLVYDLSTGVMSNPVAMPTDIDNFAAIVKNEYIYLFGGTTPGGFASNRFFRFNTTLASFEELQSSPEGAQYPVATVKGNQLWFFAEWDSSDFTLQDAALTYELSTAQWAFRPVENLDLLYGSILSRGGRFYEVGSQKSSTESNSVFVIDFLS